MEKQVSLIQFQYSKTLPLGALYLAYGLEKEKIPFDVNLFQVSKFYEPGRDIDILYSFLVNSKEIIAIGCFSDMLPYVLLALKKIKQKFPRKVIILGGVGPTMVAGEILNSFDFVDFVIKGCGISSLPKLVKAICRKDTKYSDTPGLFSKYNRPKSNTPPNISIGEIPKIPAYNRIKDSRLYSRFLIKTSSGCPYQCTFCYALAPAGRKVRNRDLDEVIEEIRVIKKIVSRRKFILRIIDEAFVVNRRRVMEFCDLLQKNNLDISWICYGRVNCMNQELLKNMSKAGCEEVYYGVESGSNQILKKIKKGFTIEEAIKIILISKKYIPHVTASFIYRYPFETVSDFIDTLMALRYLQFKNITTQLHPLAPVKHSEIYLNYGDKLRFSLDEPCDYMGYPRTSLSRKCIELIKEHPDVFYDYRYYHCEDLNKINRLFSINRKNISLNIRSPWNSYD